MRAHTGRYIVLEGDEGAGKTAQLARLQTALEQQDLAVKIVREPGGDAFAEEMRRILKHAEYHIPPATEALAFSAARSSMLAQVVKPLLDDGVWVLSDRSYLSTLIYQGIGHGLDSSDFRRVVAYGAQAAPPDLIMILDISFAEAERRQQGRGLPTDRFDLGSTFRHTINSAYRDFPATAGIVHVNGEGSLAAVSHRIMTHIAKLMPETQRPV